jgi:hypothetical protein
MASSGVSDLIKISKETTYADGGVAGEKVFGVTRSFAWKAEASTQQTYGLETSGPGATVNTDGVLQITGTHEFDFTDGRALECIMGTLVQGTNTFYMNVANVLPSYAVEVVDEVGTNKYVKISGIKYTKMAINLARGDTPIKCTADWIGKSMASTTTFTPTASTVEPLMYLDGYIGLGTSSFSVDVDNVTLELDRKCTGARFIESTAANSRRLISEIIEGSLSISVNGNITAKNAVLQEIYGGTTMNDTRTDKNIFLHVGRGTTQLRLTITGGRYISAGRTLQKDNEISLMDFAGIGIGITGTGSNP